MPFSELNVSPIIAPHWLDSWLHQVEVFAREISKMAIA